jgi:hypothetical protein
MKQLLFSLICLCQVQIYAAEPERYSSMVAELQMPEVLTDLYRAAHPNRSQSEMLKKVVKKNDQVWQLWRQKFETSARFVRGEVDSEQTLNGLILWFQYSVLHSRSQPEELNKNVSAWLQMSADMAYEESSLIGMRAASVLRNLSLDLLQEKVSEKGQDLKAVNALLRRARAPWPIDRVLIAEGKKVLQPTALQVLERGALELQKNPYQSLEQALKRHRGHELSVLVPFKEMWTNKDIERMTGEVNRLGLLQVQSAQILFLQQKKRRPSSVEELLSSGLLDRVPIDYKTGKKMGLSSQL